MKDIAELRLEGAKRKGAGEVPARAKNKLRESVSVLGDVEDLKKIFQGNYQVNLSSTSSPSTSCVQVLHTVQMPAPYILQEGSITSVIKKKREKKKQVKASVQI